MAKRNLELNGVCPQCGEPIEINQEIDIPVVEVIRERIVPEVEIDPITAQWLKPVSVIKEYRVTTKDLLEYLRILIETDIPNATLAGISLVLGDSKTYSSEGEFTELLVGITGALNNNVKYTRAEQSIIDASDRIDRRTPIIPILEQFMFDNNYLQQYIRKGDYQRRNKLKRKLGIGEDALHELMRTSCPNVIQMNGDKGNLILVGLDVEKIMAGLFSTRKAKVHLKDAEGNYLYNEDGKPKYLIKRTEAGKPIIKDGKPVYAEEPVADVIGEIKLAGITPLSEFDVEYLVYYRAIPGSKADKGVNSYNERTVQEMLERISRNRKR